VSAYPEACDPRSRGKTADLPASNSEETLGTLVEIAVKHPIFTGDVFLKEKIGFPAFDGSRVQVKQVVRMANQEFRSANSIAQTLRIRRLDHDRERGCLDIVKNILSGSW
jgi:hypothetical protein